MKTTKQKSTSVNELQHSGLGIAAFVISLSLAVLYAIVITIAGLMEVNTPGGVDETSSAAILLGLGIIATVLINLVGLGLGIAGVVHKDRKKIFGILGLIFNSCLLLSVTLLLVIGTAAQ